MKKILSALLMLMLLLSATAAYAKTLSPDEVRNITVQATESQAVAEGISPTTGRALSSYTDLPAGALGQAVTGRYAPVLVQIDNAAAGIGYRAPWNASWADVMYETPLYKAGMTRMSFLYNDVMPGTVGPVRSARVLHAWLREEWDCAFCFFGQQEYAKTNVLDEFAKYGTNGKGILFSGMVSDTKPWAKYYTADEVLASPHNKFVDISGIASLIPDDFTPAKHDWRFTEEVPEGDPASEIRFCWGNAEYDSLLEYDEDEQCYYRYIVQNPLNPQLYEDYVTHEAITFENVIVQFIECEWPVIDAPLPTVTGTGNADYFMRGMHYAGIWERKEIQAPTVFYGEDGSELELTPGRTLIVMVDGHTFGRTVDYE